MHLNKIFSNKHTKRVKLSLFIFINKKIKIKNGIPSTYLTIIRFV